MTAAAPQSTQAESRELISAIKLIPAVYWPWYGVLILCVVQYLKDNL